ncbi:hypothetical protein GOP47_0000264 [Adiantum capillus-veneris]|uniref:Uncharacterized protein n=1 Tax=Adiantum capillus-veneris TaxID=13818 RepID=A0A9D4VDL8_ADICA|nr:hypothetical protein GOP47_0000264 [Adiantum capillus-veneris]
MASRKVIRRLGALLHPSRGFCHKQELGDQLHPRSSSQLLAALEPHVTSSGKELFQGLMDVSCLEKEVWKQKQDEIEYQKEAIEYQNKEIAYLERSTPIFHCKMCGSKQRTAILYTTFFRSTCTQVQIFLCIGKAAKFDIEEDPSTRPC